ncbi:protease, partial [Streptomyces sp. GC420]|nr:protease [Streptomyces sp. GC420]
MQRDDLEAVFYGDGRVPVPWATDCPVRFDAWRAFTEPGPPRQESHEHREDLILAINEEHGIQRVMDHFWSLGMTECQPVASGSFVAARLTLDELVRAVVPMTNLCGVVRSAREIALTEGTQGVEDALEGRFRKQPRTSDIHDNLERRHERSRQLTWFLNVLARVIMDAPAHAGPPSGP